MTAENAGATAARPLAFFIPGLNGGGAQRVFVTLVNTLVTMTDHPIHLVTSRDGGVFESRVDPRVVRVILGQNRVSLSVLSLAHYIRVERPVAMVSTLDYCNVVFLVATMFTRTRLRKVIREANVLQEDFESIITRSRAIILRTLMRLFYRRADDVIIITRDVERSLLRHRIVSADRMRRIPNPVLMEAEAPSVSASSAVPAGPFILAIGRLSQQKGFDILIRAFAKLPNREAKLVILGEGPQESQLRALAAEQGVGERVVFPGFVDNTAPYLRLASLFVLSSRWEGFSNVLTEALAAGTPIVSTDCPGSPREVLDGGRFGRLADVGAPEQLAKAMAAELRSQTASAEARKERAKHYAANRVAELYLRLFLAEDTQQVPGASR